MKKTFWEWVGDLWCRVMHPAPMWPVHGYYRCPACWRQYIVPWEASPLSVAVESVRPVLDHPRMGGDKITRPAHSW